MADVRIVVGCVAVVDADWTWARERLEPPWRRISTSSPVSTLTLELRPGQEPPLDRFTIAGTPEEVAARVIDHWEAGADRVELGTPGAGRRATASGSSATACCRSCGAEVAEAQAQASRTPA